MEIWFNCSLNGKIENLKTFINVSYDAVAANGSKTYTLSNKNQVALMFANNGNGHVAMWAVSFRNANEIGVQLVTADNTSSCTVTTSGMTFTINATYTTNVKVVVF